MKKILTAFINKLLIITCLLFSITKGNAADRPIAEAVAQKHDLKIGFPTYNLFSNVQDLNSKNLPQELSIGTVVSLKSKELFSLLKQSSNAISVNIPFDGDIITVELVNVNILTPDFTIHTSDNNNISYIPGKYYRGIIKDNPNSIAAFSFFNDELYGVVSDNVNGNIVIGRILQPGNINKYIIYSDKDLIRTTSEFCKMTDYVSDTKYLHQLSLMPSQTNTNKCAKLYYETDYNIYLRNNSNVINTVNWITAVHNNVATLFSNDLISVALSEVFVWTTVDPYTGADATEQLNLFKTTRTSFNGDAGQLVAIDENNGGLSLGVNTLCSTLNYSYSDIDFSFSAVPTYSWTIQFITHEFGHILGSPHTNNCSWPGGSIDNCAPSEGICPPGPAPVNGGTIMSNCQLAIGGINFNNGFGPLPAAAIQNAVNSASCLGTLCVVCPSSINNECTTPVTLNINTNCVYTSGTFCGATQSISTINCGSRQATSGNDVWFKITPGQSNIVINGQSGSTTDLVLAIYSGTCGGITLISCSDATTNGGMETITAAVMAGTPYLIRLYDFNGKTTGTNFGICVTQSCLSVPNNDCLLATNLNVGTSCTYINGELCSATQSLPPEECSSFISTDAFDLFYKFTPPQSNVRITCKSGLTTDMVLGLYTGTCGSLNILNCSDTSTSGGTEVIDTLLVPGTTYYLRVYDWNSNVSGTDFQLCVQYIPCTPPAPPASVTATNSTICSGTTTTLSVNGILSAGANWYWYSGSCGGTPLGSGPFIVVSPSTTTTYFVREEYGTCYSVCRNITVNVILTPAAPASASALPASICASSSSSLSVAGVLTAGASWQWYSSSCGGTPEGTGVSISVSPLVSTNYFVRAVNGICYSACVNTTLSVADIPNDPVSANGNSPICSGANSTLQVNGTLSAGAKWYWYNGSCGGTAIDSGSSIIVSPSATTTYFVRAKNGDCISNCTSVTVSVIPSPSAPISANASPATLCTSVSSTLSVTGTLTSGATWNWYSSSCGGTPVGTGNSISVSPLSTTNYFVRAENGTCSSICKNALISVSTTPSNPVSASGSSPICSGSNSTLQVSGTLSAGATWHWYKSSCGGIAEGTGSSIIVSPSSTTTYYVRAENNGCFSNCSSVIINVNPTPTAPSTINASPAFFCSSGASSTLGLTGTLSAGATWKWYSGSCGGTPVGTGVSVSVSPTTSTNYFVRAENGTCNSICLNTSVSVASIPLNPVSASGTSPVCAGSNSTLQVNGTLSAGAVWKWYNGSCGGISIGTGTSISVAPTSTTIYYVRAENGSCYSNCSSTTVIVNSTPASPSALNASPSFLCSAGSSTLTLTGTLSPGAAWHWYTGTCGGTPAGTGTSITVSPLSTTSYFVRAENGNCSSVCVNTSVSVAPTPADPVSANGNSPICSASNSVLQVNGTLSPGATWHWYSDSCNGMAIDTGSIIIVSPTVASTYYVRAENGSCFSNCVNTSVSVIPNPADPIPINSSSIIICSGDSVILSETGIPSTGSSWYWYVDSCGGNSIGQGTTIVVSPLTNKTYFVRAEDSNCRSNCLNIAINVNPTPTQPAISVNSDTLSVVSHSSYQWFWSSDRSAFDLLGTARQQKAVNDGYYFVIVSDINGCAASSDTILFLHTNVFTEFNSEFTLSVYPNPFNENINVILKTATKGTADLKIFNTEGRLVYLGKILDGKTNVISLANFAAGIYQLVFTVEGKLFRQKILKL